MNDTVSPTPRSKSASCAILLVLAGFILSCVAGAFLITPEARQNLITATYIVIGITTTAAIGFGLWFGVEQLLTIRARRKQIQNEAEFNVYETLNGDLHIRELNKGVDWRAASRDPRVYANGHWVAPTSEEINAFGQWMLTQTGSAGQAKQLAAAQPVLALPNPIDLRDVLRRTRKVLVVGPEGGGKTSLLHAIIRQRLGSSQVVVIDPHGNKDDWPAGCEVVGCGRRYDLIETRFRDIETELDKRYKMIAQHSGYRSTFKHITVVIDEWTQLLDNVENGKDFIRMMLTESRKAAIAIFVAGHSERVELLGLKGSGDLKKGFVTVRLYYDQVSHQRRQSIDYGDDIGERDAAFYPDGGGVATPEPTLLPSSPPVSDEDLEATEDEEFVRLVQEEGLSRRRASLQAYGKPYSGEKIVNRARRALNEL